MKNSSFKEIDKLVKGVGMVRGVVLCTDAEYILRHEGEQTLWLIEEETKNMGYPIEYSKINCVGWYPVGLRAVSLLAIKKVLGWNDEQMKEMGKAAPKHSLVTKLMLRYFVSLDRIVEKAQAFWNKNYTVGKLITRLEDNAVFFRLEDCQIPDPLFPYLEGYFTGSMNMVIGNHHHMTLEKVKRTNKNGDCQEFVIRW